MFFSVLNLGVNAQITLDDTDISSVGTIYEMTYDTSNLGGFSAGSSGAGQTWDFSLLDSNYMRPVTIVNRKSGPYEDKFPEASAVMSFTTDDNTPLYMFLDLTPTSLTAHGIAYDETWGVRPVPIVPPDTMFSFPVKYLDNHSNTSVADILYPGDTVKNTMTTVRIDTVDGHGTLITPDSTIMVLRIKKIEYSYDTLYGLINDTTWVYLADEMEIEVQYEWWAKGIGHPVVELDVDSAGNTIRVKYITEITRNASMPYFNYATDGLEVTFMDSSFNNPGMYYWTFGDGSDSDFQITPIDVSHVYPATGVYRACLMTGENGIWHSVFCDSVWVDNVITESMLPDFESTWMEVHDTIATGLTVSVNDSGTGNSWDYSNAFIPTDYKVLHVEEASETKYGSYFPTATHALDFEDEEFTGYYIIDGTGLTTLGLYDYRAEVDTTLVFTDPELIFAVPLALGDIVYDTSGLEIPFGDGSVKMVQTKYKIMTCDAEGDLQTPTRMYNGVLRVKSEITEINDIYVFNNGTGQWDFSSSSTTSSSTYQWMGRSGYNIPTIMEIELDSAGNAVEGYYLGSDDCLGITNINYITFDDSTFLFMPVTPDSLSFQEWIFDEEASYETFSDKWYTFKSMGQKEIILVTITDDACIELATLTLNLDTPVCDGYADFDYTIDSLTVNFYDSSMAAGINTWAWNLGDYKGGLGDGFHSNDTNATYTYEQPGEYDVMLIVSDEAGCSYGALDEIMVTGDGCYGYVRTIYFDETTMYFFVDEISDTNVVSIEWDMGDGSPLRTDADLIYSFPNKGIYEVCVTIVMADGCTSTICDSIDLINPTCVGMADFDYVVDSNIVYFYDQSYIQGKGILGTVWNFGDPNSNEEWDSEEINPEYSYSQLDYYNITHLVYDTAFECIFAVQRLIGVTGEQCFAEFEYWPDTMNTNTIIFSNSSYGDITDLYWEFGDGMTSDAIDPTHTFPNAGTYDVCLTVFDQGSGCMEQFCEVIQVGDDSTACFTRSEYAIFPDAGGYGVFFSNNSDNYSHSYWDFGDGNYSQNESSYHVFPGPGYYVVCLGVYDDSTGCQDVFCDYIKVGEDTTQCYILAEYSNIPDATGNGVKFNNESQGFNELYWAFGDGEYSINLDPYHMYMDPGYYEVCLVVHDSIENCMDQLCKTIKVGPEDTLSCFILAEFNMFPDTVGNGVTFQNKSVNFTSVFWSFGDNNYSAQEDPYHMYTDPGYYDICMVAHDSISDCMATWCKVLRVGGEDSTICDVASDFEYITDRPTQTVTFNNTSYHGQYSYWDFGDGTNANDYDPEHTFSDPGIYYVCMAAINIIPGDTCIDVRCQFVEIEDPDTSVASINCASDFIYTVDNSTKTVTFQDESSGSPDFWYWNFDDFTIANNDQDPVHQFADGGYYEVCLTVYRGSDCQDTYCEVITIEDASNDVYADFTYYADPVTSTAYFQNQSLGTSLKYNWDFGDTQFSTFENPTHTYADTGRYLVCLTVENGNSIKETTCDFVQVGNTLANKCEFSCVWPGDANNSLEANHYDLLSICVSYGEIGPARDSVSTRWIGHYSENWTTIQYNGQNNKHADCDGDGIVDLQDIVAIANNFSSSHPYQPGKRSRYNPANPDLYFEITGDIAPGSTVEVAIMASRDTNTTLYGIGFELKIDMQDVVTNSVAVAYDNSWLGIENTNMYTYDYFDESQGIANVSVSRFDRTNQTGKGEITSVSFTIDSTLSDDIVICLTSDFGMDANGDTITFNADICDTLKMVSIIELPKSEKIKLYPNPTKGTVTFNVPELIGDEYEFVLINTLGQEVLRKNIGFGGIQEMDISKFDDGLYYVEIVSDKARYQQRLYLIK